jgi:hypothetical protein
MYKNGIIVSRLCVPCLISKGKKKREQQSKIETLALKEKLKTHSQWLNELQRHINKIARLIDYGQTCIARPNLQNENGGHFKSVGGNSNIRFNLHNIHGQSIHSNKWKGGEEGLYRLGLIRVYGIEYCEYVESLNLLYPTIRLSKDEVKLAISISKSIIKELESFHIIYTSGERIELRNKYNKLLGIYT